jgi:sulfatase maturation enzyme AslB (radical SAM superfamily)
MDWDTLRAAVDKVFTWAAKEITLLFIGGEPLLEWELICRIAEYARSRLPAGMTLKYEISTNGLLITDEIARFLDKLQFNVQLSFDGIASAQEYRRNGSFEALDALLDTLRRITPNLFCRRLRISSIQVPETVPHLSETIRYFMKKGIREVILYPALRPRYEWKVEDIEALDAQFGRVYADSLRCLEETGTVPIALFRKYADDDGPTRSCSAVVGNTLVVDADGQAYGCVLFAESYQELCSDLLKRALVPLRMGDFRDDNFRERHSEYVKKIENTEIFGSCEERHSSYGRCADCSYRNACRVCPVSIACDPVNVDPHRVPDFICAYNRVSLKYRTMFPCMPDPLELLKVRRGR